MKNYDELRDRMEGEGGLLRATMGELRDIQGAGKLGVLIRQAISDRLAAHGMGHLPAALPSYQEEEVRVFRLGSPIAETVNAVLRPSQTGDDVLRRSAGSDAQKILKQVRELVCE